MQKFVENHAIEVMVMTEQKIKFQHFKKKNLHITIQTFLIQRAQPRSAQSHSIPIKREQYEQMYTEWSFLSEVTINKTDYLEKY